MRFLPKRFFFLHLPIGIGLTASVVIPDAAYPVLLERYNQDIRRNPQNYLKRVERAFLVLEQGDSAAVVGEDIDTLLLHLQWRAEGNRLKAMRLHHQKRFAEARVLIRENIRANVHVREQAELLADIELLDKDTAAAVAAFRTAWDHDSDETDFINLLDLYRGRGKPPEKFIQQGLRLYPRSAGSIQSIFEVYEAAGDSACLKKAVEISEHAEKILWPLSIDWKISHARVLIALKRRREAEPILLAALDLLDDDARLKGKDSELFRKQIFDLLEESRK